MAWNLKSIPGNDLSRIVSRSPILILSPQNSPCGYQKKQKTSCQILKLGVFVPENKTAWEQASEWFGRTIAIVLVMVAPGAAGAWVDGRMGTSFLAALGFVLGMVLAIGLLMLFSRIKPIDNDGPIMNRGSSPSAAPSPTRSPQRAFQKPSESRLPELPGAEVHEAPHDE